MRRAAKIDENQPEIVDALRKCGIKVHITSQLGDGFPDLVCGFHNFTFLLEVKMPNGKMTAAEMRFANEWDGHYMVVRTVEQALDAVTNPAARRVEMTW
jgi:hypothetical protein